MRSHRAAPGAPPRAQTEQLRTFAAEKDDRWPLTRRRQRLEAALAEARNGHNGLSGAQTLHRGCCDSALSLLSPAHQRMRHKPLGDGRGTREDGNASEPSRELTRSQRPRARIARRSCPSTPLSPIGRLLGGALRLLRKAEVWSLLLLLSGKVIEVWSPAKAALRNAHPPSPPRPVSGNRPSSVCLPEQ